MGFLAIIEHMDRFSLPKFKLFTITSKQYTLHMRGGDGRTGGGGVGSVWLVFIILLGFYGVSSIVYVWNVVIASTVDLKHMIMFAHSEAIRTWACAKSSRSSRVCTGEWAECLFDLRIEICMVSLNARALACFTRFYWSEWITRYWNLVVNSVWMAVMHVANSIMIKHLSMS